MPIIGLTDDQSVRPTLPTLGKLRKGSPKSGNAPGRETPTFRFTALRPDVQAAWNAAFPTEPASLTAYLPFGSWRANFATCKEAWTASRLQHRCDGRTTTLLYDDKSKTYDRTPHPCPGGCKEVGYLRIVIPELLSAGYVGTVTVETHGKWDLINLSGELAEMEGYVFRRGTDMTGLEIRLYRQEEDMPSPDGSRRKHWNIHAAISEEWVRRQIAATRTYAIGGGPVPVAQIEGGLVIDEATGEILQDPDREEVDDDPEQDPDEAVVEAPAVPAPQARVQGKKVEKPQSKTKAASVKSAKFKVRAAEFADDHPEFMGESGPDLNAILKAAGEAGYEQVTDENLEEVLQKIVNSAVVGAKAEQGEIPF